MNALIGSISVLEQFNLQLNNKCAGKFECNKVSESNQSMPVNAGEYTRIHCVYMYVHIKNK